MRAPRQAPPGCDPESIVLSFPVAREHAGQRLDRFLVTCIPRLSRTRANTIVRKCAYHADGRRRMASDRVRYGEEVLIVRPPMREPDAPTDFSVLYEDDDVVAVDKPPGLPMHPSASYHKKTLAYQLYERFGNPAPQIAHRLDRETSGVVVCAKHPDAERQLKQDFEARRVDKHYVAIVEGSISGDDGVIDRPIGSATEGLHVKMAIREDGEGLPASTEWTVVGRRSSATMVRLHPVTGRQHQLRVHLASIGHPIVGCKLYGPEGEGAFIEAFENGMTPSLLARLGHRRHALHAASLAIVHPRTGRPLAFEAPLPEDMRMLWESRA